MRRVLLAFVALVIPCIAISGYAEGEPAATLAALLSGMHAYQADFRQTSLDAGGNETQVLAGEFAVKRPGMLHWHVKPPLEQLVVSDGEKLWLYDPDLEQVTVQQVDPRLEQTPALLLSGDIENLSTAFLVTEAKVGQAEDPEAELSAAEAEKHRRYRAFELVPKQADSLFEYLKLTFRGDKLVQMHMTDSLGQRSSLEFVNVLTNPVLDDKLFQFTPPAGVDIISQ